MAKEVILRKADHEALYFVRWVLFLVVSAEAAGIEKLSRHRLHALLFLSFASSPYYRIKPLRQRAQRTEHGPYYRAAHLALGNLALGGLIRINHFAAHPSPKDLQFEATFALTPQGLKVAQALRATLTGERLYKFLLDMCLASVAAMGESLDAGEAVVGNDVSSRTEPTLERMLERDLSYREAMERDEAVLRVTETSSDRPTTVRGLESIDGYLNQSMAVNQRDVFTAYQRLLKRRAA